MWRILSGIAMLMVVILTMFCSQKKTNFEVSKLNEFESSLLTTHSSPDSLKTSGSDKMTYEGILTIKTDDLQKVNDSITILNIDGSIYAKIISFQNGEPSISGVDQIEIREYYPEYYVIIFDANFSKEDKEYLVYINGRSKIIKHHDGITKFQSIEEHVISSIIGGDEKNPVRDLPSTNGKVIAIGMSYNDLAFEVVQMEGDWIKVRCLKDCEGCPNDILFEGWMIWKHNETVIVDLYYVC